jgi:hypothetical protein
VFLSYARDDASELVQKVRSYLEAADNQAWVDVVDIAGGTDWRDEIESGIRNADAVVLIMTPAAIASDYVQREVQFAQDWGKRIVPLAMGEVKPPDWLRSKQYIRFKQFDDGAALGKLSGALNTVWQDVEAALKELRYNVVTDDLMPLLDHLQTILSLPRPVVRPEAVLAGAEFIDRMSRASEKRPLVELLIEWRGGGFVAKDWKHYAAYDKHKVAIKKLLDEGFKTVQIPPVRIVPFVLVVMTADEARELESEQVFDAGQASLRAHYKTILQSVVSHGVANWVGRYQARPELWQPFDDAPGGQSLQALIAHELNRPGTAPRNELRRAQFIDIRTINEAQNRDQLNELRASGCVVLLDVLSVCHPKLLTEYRRSLLDIFPATFLLKIGPFDPVPVYGKLAEHVTTLPFVQKADSFFYERHTIDLDPKCAVAGEEVAFKKFMREKVMDLFLKNPAGYRQHAHQGGG